MGRWHFERDRVKGLGERYRRHVKAFMVRNAFEIIETLSLAEPSSGLTTEPHDA